jgi:hypothetical protein
MLTRLFQRSASAPPAQEQLPATLASSDLADGTKRLFVMGCGRSGTWLLTALFSTFADLQIYPDETPVTRFATLRAEAPILLLKRDQDAYQTVEAIPTEIGIACMVRHPFDVLTSYNPTSGRKYHITPHRWLGEMLALQYLLDSGRPNTAIIRYEDLVTDPHSAQQRLANHFDLRMTAPPEAITTRFTPSPSAASAMHSLRPIDSASLGKHRQDAEKLAYLRQIRPRLGRLLEWVAQEYGYDISL